MYHRSPVPLQQQRETSLVPFADPKHQLSVSFQGRNSLHVFINTGLGGMLRVDHPGFTQV
jgi:hypothetical protein